MTSLASMQHTNTLPIFPTQAVASRPDLRRLRDKSPYSFFLRRGSPASERGRRAWLPCAFPSPSRRSATAAACLSNSAITLTYGEGSSECGIYIFILALRLVRRRRHNEDGWPVCACAPSASLPGIFRYEQQVFEAARIGVKGKRRLWRPRRKNADNDRGVIASDAVGLQQ